MKKRFILVAAPPACGKTFVSELVAKSLGRCTYLDKDDLAPLLRQSFALQNQPLNMDGEFYLENFRSVEYETILRIAFSALRFDDTVILNAPFGKEVRDSDYIRQLKEKANAHNADLILIWVSCPTTVCYQRMKNRNADRDFLKLANWDSYIKTVNYSAPVALETEHAVDKLIVFDTTDEQSTQTALSKTLEMMKGA